MGATVEQQGFILTGDLLLPCSGCLEAKWWRSAIFRRPGRDVRDVLGAVHLDLTGPYVRLLGGSALMMVYVDRYSRFMMVYGVRRKVDALGMIKGFIADVRAFGVPACVRIVNDKDFTSSVFDTFCYNAETRREYTALDTTVQNGVAESAICRTTKAGHAARLEAPLLVLRTDVSVIPLLFGNLDRLWLEAAAWVAGGFNLLSTTAYQRKLSPYEAFTRKPPWKCIVPLPQHRLMRINECPRPACSRFQLLP